MSETPRTDLQVEIARAQGHDGYVNAAFARVVEGELLDARGALEAQRKNYIDLCEAVTGDDGTIAGTIDPFALAKRLRAENAKLRTALDDIHIWAHCIAKAGPLHTPTLEAVWPAFNRIAVMATAGLQRIK